MHVRTRFGTMIVGLAAGLSLLAPAGTAYGAGYNTWAAIYGGSGAEEMEGLRQTSDGGYIVAGSTDSFGDPNGDAWVVKLDEYGNVQWQKTYGGLNDESLVDVRQTPDGGYITVGWTKSFGVAKTDMWVVKLSSSGAIEWEKAYGAPGKEQAWSVYITSDGSYLIAGGTTSFGAGRADYWVLKLDPAGNILWQNTYGGSRNDGGGGAYAEYVVRAIEDSDGNYVVASETYSFGSGASDIWVLKLDPTGNILWQKAYGGFDEDSMWSFAETADGGYIVPGSTVSFSPDFSGDMWILKLTKFGDIEWQKVFGVPKDWDEVLSVGATADGGSLIGGYVEQGNQDWDLLLLRLDAAGNSQWQKRYEHGWDWPNAIEETADGGFAVAAVTWPRPPDEKLWVLRLGADGGIGSSCSLIHNLTLSEAVTNATPIATNAVPQATSVSPQVTSAVVQDSTAAPNFLCQGQPAENCANGVDDDGDGLTDCDDPDCQGDGDGDGYVAAPCGTDCDDADPAVNPAAAEVCDNAKDDECDGLSDCNDPDCQTNIDTDGDGYFALPCGTDCDDADPAVNPAAAEVCDNAKDDECDGLADCDDSECISLPVCTLGTTYCRHRSTAKFNLRRPGRDRAVVRMCVTQSFCDALAAMAGDAGKTLRATLDACPDLVVAGDALTANAAATVFKAKSPPDQVPAYSIKVSCRKLKALVKLRQADLQACVTNPVAVTVAADGTRPLQAEAQFTEIQDRHGNLRGMALLSSEVCTN